MALISDTFHKKILKQNNINIKTKYIVGNKILERNTDDSFNDDIVSGIRCEKDYFINDKFVHKETNFDSRMEYTFVSKYLSNKMHKCVNCGMSSNLKDFIDGCPYCRSYYNIDYTDKTLGSKFYYDRVLRSGTYRIITAIVDVIISVIICLLFIKFTSRTFNNIDIIKSIIYGLILSAILYYFFYILDAYIILGPIKKYKDNQNKKQQEFWNTTKIDKKKFFNNLNYEVSKYYYSKDSVVDFDILDFDEFSKSVVNNIEQVNVKAYVRIVEYKNDKILSKYIVDTFILEHINSETLELKDGANLIKCHNCGASINAVKEICEYCHTNIKPLQEWIIKYNK